jgi:16S rRNA processing protein RimM
VLVHTASGLISIGTASSVLMGAGEAPLLVVKGKSGEREQEYLVPYAEEFLKLTDLARRRIEMQLPEGLLELQVPLSAEEKQLQKLEADESRAAGERRKGHK